MKTASNSFKGRFVKIHFLILSMSLAVVTAPSRATTCPGGVAGTTELTMALLLKKLQDPKIALSTHRVLVERLSESRLELPDALRTEIVDAIHLAKKAEGYEAQVKKLAEILRISVMKAERLFLALDFELRGPNRHLIRSLKTMSHRRGETAEVFLSREKRQSEEEWIHEHQDSLFAKYERHLQEQLLEGKELENHRKLVLNKVAELDSAHAIRYDIESGFGLLGPRLVIQGFYRVGPSSTALHGSSSLSYQLHLNRFVNQLLRFNGQLEFEGARFVPEMILIETTQGKIPLRDFQRKYAKEMSYDESVTDGRRERQALIIDLFGSGFMRLLVPKHPEFAVNGPKDFGTLELEVAPVFERTLQTSFLEGLLVSVPKLKSKMKSKKDLAMNLGYYVFNFKWPSQIGTALVKYYISPSFKLPKIAGLEAPKKAVEVFTANEHSVFRSLKSGAAGAIVAERPIFRKTPRLYQRLKQIADLLPSQANHTSVVQVLNRSKISNTPLSGFEREFRHSQVAFAVLRDTFTYYNRLVRDYNSRYGKSIPEIDMSEILTRSGIDKAISLMEKYGVVIAKGIEEVSAGTSRVKELQRMKRLSQERLEKSTSDIQQLNSIQIESFRGSKAENRKGAIDVLADRARALSAPLFNPGNTQVVMDRLLFHVKKDFQERRDFEFWEQLETRLSGIKFTRQDAANARKASSAPVNRMYAYLVILARAVKELSTEAQFDPESVFTVESMEAFLEAIPSVRILHAKRVLGQEVAEAQRAEDRAQKAQDRKKHWRQLSPEQEAFFKKKKTGPLGALKELAKEITGSRSLHRQGDFQVLIEGVLESLETSYPHQQAIVSGIRERISEIYPEGQFLYDGANVNSNKRKYADARARVYSVYMLFVEGVRSLSGEKDLQVEDTQKFVQLVLRGN